jgi:hypothetical protein
MLECRPYWLKSAIGKDCGLSILADNSPYEAGVKIWFTSKVFVATHPEIDGNQTLLLHKVTYNKVLMLGMNNQILTKMALFQPDNLKYLKNKFDSWF